MQRLRTTTARRLSAYNVVDSVATNTTPRFREINTQITRSRRRCISFVKSLQERYVIVHRSLIMLLWVCWNSERVTPNGAFYTKIHDCRPISRFISETIYEGWSASNEKNIETADHERNCFTVIVSSKCNAFFPSDVQVLLCRTWRIVHPAVQTSHLWHGWHLYHSQMSAVHEVNLSKTGTQMEPGL